MNILAPSILAADFTRLGEQIAVIEKAGAQYLHFDVMDGHFVPNISFGVPILESVRKITEMTLDVHLMISEPEKYIAPFAKAGADIINFHIEAAADPAALIKKIHALGKRAGITLKPGTPPETVFPYAESLEMVLIMSVEPGFGGQKMIEGSLEKARQLRDFAAKNGLTLDIEMDGGIHLGNAADVTAAGVNVVVAGSAVFAATDIGGTVRAFLEQME
jgi:ribulose-phosphate 3-epimerase